MIVRRLRYGVELDRPVGALVLGATGFPGRCPGLGVGRPFGAVILGTSFLAPRHAPKVQSSGSPGQRPGLGSAERN